MECVKSGQKQHVVLIVSMKRQIIKKNVKK